MLEKEKCMQWIKEEFPDVLDNHFNWDMMENLIDWAHENKNVAKGQMINFLTLIVPEITAEEWERFYIE